MLIAVLVIGGLSSVCCCAGIGGYLMLAARTTTTTSITTSSQKDRAPSGDPASSKGPKLATLPAKSDLRAFWSKARAQKIGLPPEPTLGPYTEVDKGPFVRTISFTWKQANPAEIWTVGPAESAYLAIAMLAGGKIDEFGQLMRLPREDKLAFLGMMAYHASCGPIVSPSYESAWTDLSTAEVSYEYGYVTKHECQIRTKVKAVKHSGKTFYMVQNAQMFSDKLPAFATAIRRVDLARARDIYKKHKDPFEKIYKARRAGMKADQYFSGQLSGTDVPIRSVVPKGKLIGTSRAGTLKLGDHTIDSMDFKIDLEGKTFTYSVFWMSLDKFSNDPKDRHVKVLIGEDVTAW